MEKNVKQYGYCRISTPKQSIDRQVRNILKEYPEAYIVKEVYTGTKLYGRREWDKLYVSVLKEARRKKVYMMNITPNEKTNIIELLATIVLLVNTFILIIFQNTITYEKVTLFEITPKSSYLTIMQHNPIFGIIYMTCGVILLICAIDRLIKYTNS